MFDIINSSGAVLGSKGQPFSWRDIFGSDIYRKCNLFCWLADYGCHRIDSEQKEDINCAVRSIYHYGYCAADSWRHYGDGHEFSEYFAEHHLRSRKIYLAV